MKKFLSLIFAITIFASCFVGCASQDNTTSKADFSKIKSICELSTLKCYYHNVAKWDKDSSSIVSFAFKKRMWLEYDSIVTLGINAAKVNIESPDANGVVRVTMPDAEILSIELDENSLTDPIEETGFLTKITTEERTECVTIAQQSLKEDVYADESLFFRAKERAKNIIEGYIQNIGKEMNTVYTVEWVEGSDTKSEPKDTETE